MGCNSLYHAVGLFHIVKVILVVAPSPRTWAEHCIEFEIRVDWDTRCDGNSYISLCKGGDSNPRFYSLFSALYKNKPDQETRIDVMTSQCSS